MSCPLVPVRSQDGVLTLVPSDAHVRSHLRGAGVELTMDMLLHAADSLIAACEAKWLLVDEAVGAGRLPFCKAPGAFYIIAEGAARRAGTYKDFRAKLPKNFYYMVPDFYVAAPLPVELIHTIMQFADGRTLARFSNCSPQLRGRADRIASEGLARITTLRLEQPAVADWRTELRLFAVITNPPNLWSLEGPDPAWVPINDHVKDYSTTLDFRTCYAELVTNYNLEDHRAYMVKYALRLGDAAVIEGVMRTTEPHERSMHVRNFYNRLYTRGRYLKNGPGSPAWCITGPECGKAISDHFLHVERVQAAAAAGKSIAEYSPLLQSAAKHDRYFPGLDDVVDDGPPDDWGRHLYFDVSADDYSSSSDASDSSDSSDSSDASASSDSSLSSDSSSDSSDSSSDSSDSSSD